VKTYRDVYLQNTPEANDMSDEEVQLRYIDPRVEEAIDALNGAVQAAALRFDVSVEPVQSDEVEAIYSMFSVRFSDIMDSTYGNDEDVEAEGDATKQIDSPAASVVMNYQDEIIEAGYASEIYRLAELITKDRDVEANLLELNALCHTVFDEQGLSVYDYVFVDATRVDAKFIYEVLGERTSEF
jgi:hypothetical protein